MGRDYACSPTSKTRDEESQWISKIGYKPIFYSSAKQNPTGTQYQKLKERRTHSSRHRQQLTTSDSSTYTSEDPRPRRLLLWRPDGARGCCCGEASGTRAWQHEATSRHRGRMLHGRNLRG